ncbi:MAG: glucan ABC transporter ATP-binding protein/ permease [Geminicoccaceae bacterium]
MSSEDGEEAATSVWGLLRTYGRALGLLHDEPGVVAGLASANVAIGLIQLAEPVLFGAVVDAIARGGAVFGLIGLWAALGIGGIAAGVVVALLADRLAHRRRTAAMAQAFERAITLPLSYHARAGSGRIVRTILAGTDALFMLWLSFFREHLSALVGILLLVPTALVMDARLAALLAALAAVYVVVNLVVVRRTTAGQRAVEQHHQDVFGRVGDVIGNVVVVQSYARLAAEAAQLQAMMRRMLAAQYPVLTWWALLTILTRASATVVMVVIFAVGATLAQAGQLSVGAIVSFVGFAQLLIGKLDEITGFIGRFFIQAPTVDAYFELMATGAEVQDQPGAATLTEVTGRVAFEGLTFRFPGAQQGVFDLTFTAEPGRTVALVGPTGSGKTTTLALLQRLRDPEAGRILLDGVDIRTLTLASLRHAMAVVFQEAGLFNRSIRENLLIGKPDASEAELESAARRAEAHEFILKKPGGYDFVIGERGQALSGGERQRLAIARALLKDAPILLLDEATSALDTETEARIKRALDSARAGRTTFVIAHRLSTIVDADLIVVLDAGRIVEQGRFDELARGTGPFARLVAEGSFTIPA